VFGGLLVLLSIILVFSQNIPVVAASCVACIVIVALESAAVGLWADNVSRGTSMQNFVLGVFDPNGSPVLFTVPSGSYFRYGYAFGFAWTGVIFAVFTIPVAFWARSQLQKGA
jgi:hypothetical protein